MKLVEILAREMDEWPEGASWASQDHDKEVRFDDPIHDFYATTLADDAGVAIGSGNRVTREMWQAERAKQEGPDWSKAPEGATHWGPETFARYSAWYKKVGAHWYYWLASNGSSWCYCTHLPREAMLRPTQQWNGEGLPPVGTVCEAVIIGERMRCTVVAHFEGRAVVILPSKESAHIADLAQLRPILPQEQNKAKEREAALKEIMDTTGACRNIAEDLYSAGYRKQEAGK